MKLVCTYYHIYAVYVCIYFFRGHDTQLNMYVCMLVSTSAKRAGCFRVQKVLLKGQGGYIERRQPIAILLTSSH